MKYTSDEIEPAEAVEAEATGEAFSVLPGSIQVYSPLQMHFLARLKRLQDARREIDSVADADPFMKRLVDRGLFATYRECLDEGVGAEARHLLNI